MADSGAERDGSSPGPDDIDKRFAEIAAELAAEARFREPSATERARTPVQPTGGRAASQQRQGGPLRRWRNKRLAAELRKPVLASGQRVPTPPSRPRRRAAPAAYPRPAPDRGYAAPIRSGSPQAVFAIVVLLALAVGAAFGVRMLFGSGTSGNTASVGAGTGSGAARTPTPSATPLFAANHPFAGSPAAGYANGSAGIVLPAAHRAGQYSSAQVSAAYKTVKRMLVAAMLNWPTMDGHKPAALGRLLIRQQRSWFYKHLTRPVRSHKGPWRSRNWVTAFAPGTEVVGSIVKVHGLPMTARQVTVDHHPALRIYADYIFVYAVQQPGVPTSRLRIVAQDYATVQFGQWYDPGGSLQPWITDFGASYAGAQCGTTDGLVHPAFPAVGPGRVAPSGAPVNPYQLGRPASKRACQATTGT
jgi:hypothetical protein